ncbi:transcriptional repressor [bacterium 210820-DFI.6.37]|nr:transcriptional repressor [bacterium 210820-DFI.6.37]
MSKQRKDILNVINESKGHLTAEEVFMKCKEKGVSVSMATVYRNLGILSEQGIIRRVSIIGQPDHYDKILNAHEHIFCDRCGKIQDIHVADLKELLEEKTGIQLQSYDLCMRYICPECKEKERQR